MGRMDSTMQMVAIMQEFHWTYDEYMNQPNYVITLILEKLKRDTKEQELSLKKAHRG